MRRSKLDEKSEVGILVGYSACSNGYRIYNPKSHKVEVSRSLKIDGNSAWDWDKSEVSPDEEATLENVGDDADFGEDEENIDHVPVRGTRSHQDVYERCNLAIYEPANSSEALKSEKWKAAMIDELEMFEKHSTWQLVERLNNKKIIGVKWVFRTKLNDDGSISRYKARLAVKGYSQDPGVDFTETFAPVARLDTIRLLLAIAAHTGWIVFQLDVKSAFLNGDLKEHIYVDQPDGFVQKVSDYKVYLLKKALYGLK